MAFELKLTSEQLNWFLSNYSVDENGIIYHGEKKAGTLPYRKTVYKRIRISNKALGLKRASILYHRAVMILVTGMQPAETIDHINFDTNDNRPSNLRLATRSQNVRHKSKSSSASGYRGVYMSRKPDRWRVQFSLNGKTVHIGTFKTKEEAALAYNQALIDRLPSSTLPFTSPNTVE